MAFHHAIHVDQFYLALVSGALRGVNARPALTRDVHELYQHWCSLRQVPALGSPAHFVRMLQDRHGVPLLRKRYAIGPEILGPHGVLFLTSPPAPRPGFEADWLGEHVTAFRAEVSTYQATERLREHA